MTRYWFDAINRCFWFKPETGTTPIDQVAAIEGMLNHPEFKPGISRIWDLTETDLSQYHPSAAIKLAKKLKTIPAQIAPSKTAVIVNDDFGVGIVRMHLGWSGIDHLEVKIFMDRQKALEWVRVLEAA